MPELTLKRFCFQSAKHALFYFLLLIFDPFFAFPTYFVWLFGLLRLISTAFLTLTSILFPLWELLWEFTK